MPFLKNVVENQETYVSKRNKSLSSFLGLYPRAQQTIRLFARLTYRRIHL